MPDLCADKLLTVKLGRSIKFRLTVRFLSLLFGCECGNLNSYVSIGLVELSFIFILSFLNHIIETDTHAYVISLKAHLLFE